MAPSSGLAAMRYGQWMSLTGRPATRDWLDPVPIAASSYLLTSAVEALDALRAEWENQVVRRTGMMRLAFPP